MSQTRSFDYGDPVVSQNDNWTRQYLLTAGVYDGFELGVDASNNLTIAAGSGLMPDGVQWIEDDDATLTFSAPGAPTNYTVVATHDNRSITGGTPVEYEIRSGLLTSVIAGVPLGWIYHTGGVPLDATMLQDAPKLLQQAATAVETQAITLQAPLINTFSDTTAMGGNITFVGQTANDLLFDVVNFVNHQQVAKFAGPAGAETLVQHIQFFANNWRPAGFSFYCNIPGAAQLQLELRDTDLNIVTITGSPISTTVGWTWQSIEVDRNSGTFAPGQPYELRLTHQVDLNQEINLARVAARFYPYPV